LGVVTQAGSAIRYVWSANPCKNRNTGIRTNRARDVLKAGADIFVVGRAITASKDVSHAADEFLEQLDREEIDQFRIMTDF
jgi:orotidine-5'-phosphate decarboxylase